MTNRKIFLNLLLIFAGLFISYETNDLQYCAIAFVLCFVWSNYCLRQENNKLKTVEEMITIEKDDVIEDLKKENKMLEKNLKVQKENVESNFESRKYWREQCLKLELENNELKSELLAALESLNGEYSSDYYGDMDKDCQKIFGVSYEEADKKRSKGVWNE